VIFVAVLAVLLLLRGSGVTLVTAALLRMVPCRAVAAVDTGLELSAPVPGLMRNCETVSALTLVV
jgi:hypothetical protein